MRPVMTSAMASIGPRNGMCCAEKPALRRKRSAARCEAAPTRRLHLFRKAEARILRDVPWVPLYHPVTVAVRHPRVRGYVLHPLRPARFETVWVAW